jgi:hypothetical protein
VALHLIKLSVGVRDIEHQTQVQEARLRASTDGGGAPKLWHRTRHRPRRADELRDGGSIYWVFGGRIRTRQRLLDFETEIDMEDGRSFCRFILEPGLVPTEPWPHRPFQGWRYLDPKDAPPDHAYGEAGEDMPEEMIAELRSLGLI